MKTQPSLPWRNNRHPAPSFETLLQKKLRPNPAPQAPVPQKSPPLALLAQLATALS